MKRYSYGHNYLSKHTPAKVKLIRRLNSEFGWNIKESEPFYYSKGAGQKTEGHAFNFWFSYEGVIYGANESVTSLLSHNKEYVLFDNGSHHIEITPNY